LKITLLGAAGGEVTGSCYLLEAASAKILVDCGMFQGSAAIENRNRIPTAAQVAQLDAVVLTHAHLDHTGRLPLLTRLGYHRPIYCTRPTIDLANLVLHDSARLQLADCERENRKRAAQGRAPIEPLYRAWDVDALRPLFRTFEYDEPTEVAKGVSVRAVDAGTCSARRASR
jgi:metallo-beta-lactamase family protein